MKCLFFVPLFPLRLHPLFLSHVQRSLLSLLISPSFPLPRPFSSPHSLSPPLTHASFSSYLFPRFYHTRSSFSSSFRFFLLDLFFSTCLFLHFNCFCLNTLFWIFFFIMTFSLVYSLSLLLFFLSFLSLLFLFLRGWFFFSFIFFILTLPFYFSRYVFSSFYSLELFFLMEYLLRFFRDSFYFPLVVLFSRLFLLTF